MIHVTDLVPRLHWCHSFGTLLPGIENLDLMILVAPASLYHDDHQQQYCNLNLMILVSLAIVNPRWSFTKQLTTASSYHFVVSQVNYDDKYGDADVHLSISTAATGKVSLVEREGVLHCVVPKHQHHDDDDDNDNDDDNDDVDDDDDDNDDNDGDEDHDYDKVNSGAEGPSVWSLSSEIL